MGLVGGFFQPFKPRGAHADNCWKVLRAGTCSHLVFLEAPSDSCGEDEARRGDAGGREMSKEAIAKPNWKT